MTLRGCASPLFFCRRSPRSCRSRSRCRRSGRLVEPLDLGGLAELCHQLGLRLAHHKSFDAILELLEGWRLAIALLLQLDDVPAELRLDRIGGLARIHLEG